MQDRNFRRDWVNVAVTAMVGASLAATISVSLGRDPLVALGCVAAAMLTTLLIGFVQPLL